MKARKTRYEGLQEDIRKLKAPAIDVWRNKYQDKEYSINLEIIEFTCICPKTSLPDYDQISIEYSPDKYCVELKSFKLYTIFYRDIGIFHEHLVNRMLEDLVEACKPRWMSITGVFNVRGGIKTTVTAQYKKDVCCGK